MLCIESSLDCGLCCKSVYLEYCLWSADREYEEHIKVKLKLNYLAQVFTNKRILSLSIVFTSPEFSAESFGCLFCLKLGLRCFQM